jgi:hypothetical protein
MVNAERCDSCGTDRARDDDLVNVQRVYLVAPSEGTVGGGPGEQVRVLDDIEVWCFVCRTMYPHQTLDAG